MESAEQQKSYWIILIMKTTDHSMTNTDELKRLAERLAGKYRVPITDGLGATGGGDEPDNPDEGTRDNG